MAVTSFASKTQQQINISRPQTTGKMRVNYNSTGKCPCPFFKTNVQIATLELVVSFGDMLLELLKKFHLSFMFLSIIPFTQVCPETNTGLMAAQWDTMVAARTFRWASRLNGQFH